MTPWFYGDQSAKNILIEDEAVFRMTLGLIYVVKLSVDGE